MGLQEEHNERLKRTSDAIDRVLSTKEGRKVIDDYFAELKAHKIQQNKELRALKKQLKTKADLDTHIELVVAENQAKIDYCNKHNHGYEKNEKGELCEISPTHSFGLLFDYFRKNGKKSMKQFKHDDMFLAESYKIENYNMNCYQGQGCFYRIYKDGKEFFQI